MKTFFNYIWHFFYVAVNWSVWLAFFTLYHDIRGGIKYGISTFSRSELHQLTLADGDASEASPYEPINYYMLERLLRAFRSRSGLRSIVDLGCGKGRVLVVAAWFGFTRITGIDLARELCAQAIINTRKKKKQFPEVTWKVVHAHVANFPISDDDSVFFMFNPFREGVVRRFLDNLEQSRKKNPRTTWIIYASPVHADTMMEQGYEVVYQKQVLNLSGIILKKAA